MNKFSSRKFALPENRAYPDFVRSRMCVNNIFYILYFFKYIAWHSCTLKVKLHIYIFLLIITIVNFIYISMINIMKHFLYIYNQVSTNSDSANVENSYQFIQSRNRKKLTHFNSILLFSLILRLKLIVSFI